MTIPHWALDLAQILTAIGVLATVATVSATNRLRKTGLSQDYIKRFWAITDDLQNARANANPAAAQHHLTRYLHLCEDEYELAALGFVDARTWSVWHTAIHQYIKHPAPADVEAVLKKEHDNLRLIRACRDTEHNAAWRCPAIKRKGIATRAIRAYLAHREQRTALAHTKSNPDQAPDPDTSRNHRQLPTNPDQTP